MSDLKTVIVTGVEGQDGFLFVEKLLSTGRYSVIGTAKKTESKFATETVDLFKDKNFKFKTIDITSAAELNSLLKFHQPYAFVNFAAKSNVQNSYDDPCGTLDANFHGFVKVLEAIRFNSPETIVINAGSVRETRDMSPYALSKAFCRKILEFYKSQFNLDGCQPYLTNHESSRRPEDFVIRKIVKKILDLKQALLDKEPFEPFLLGDVDAECDWLDADVVMDILLKILESWDLRQIDCQIVSGESNSVLKAVEIALNAAKIPYETDAYGIPMVEGQYIFRCSESLKRKTKNIFHFESQISNDFGIEPERLSFENLIKKLIKEEILGRQRKI